MMVANMSLRGTRSVSLLRGCKHTLQSVVREPQGRCLSNTRAMQRYGPVPKFHEVSNPQLATTLENFRNLVVMPAHLSKEQRNMIFRPKYKRQLELEPVIANLSGEEFKLEHLSDTKKPSAYKTFSEAMQLMTPEEWENMPRLLTALNTGGFDVMKKDHPMRLVRNARLAGRLDIIVKCLTQGDQTGLRMRNTKEAVTILRLFSTKAETDSTLQDIEETVGWVKPVLNVLSTREKSQPPQIVLPTLYSHLTEDDFAAGQKRPDASPEVVGIFLQVFAIRASKFYDGEDKDGSVLQWAKKMISLSQSNPRIQSPIATDIHEEAQQSDKGKENSEISTPVEEEPQQPKTYDLKYEPSNFMPFHVVADFKKAYNLDNVISHPTELYPVAWFDHRLRVLYGLKLASKVLDGKAEAQVLDYLYKELSREFYQAKELLERFAKDNNLVEKMTLLQTSDHLLGPPQA